MSNEIDIDALANDKFGAPEDGLKIEQSMAEPSIDQLADSQFPAGEVVPAPVVSTVQTGIQQTEAPPTSIDPRLNKAIGTFYGDNAPTAFEQGVHQAFGETGEKLKGLVWQDGQPSTSEFSKGVSQFAMAMPGFMLGAGIGIDKSSKEMQRQVWNKDVPFNLEQVADEFVKGLHEGGQYFQPTVEMLSGAPTPSSNLVGEVAMAPLNALVASGEKLASLPIFSDSPNIRGAIKIVASATGLVVNGRLMHPKAPNPSNVLSKVAEEIKPLVEEATGIAKAFDAINAEIAKVDLTDPNAVAEAKILGIKKAQLEIGKKRIDDKLAEVTKRYGEDAITEEDMLSARDALNKGRLVPTARTGLKRPSKTEIKKVTAEIPKADEIPGDVPPNEPSVPTEDVPFEVIADEKMKAEAESVISVEEAAPAAPRAKRRKIVKPTEEAMPKPIVESPSEPILPIDEKVGIEAESNVNANSPFRTSPEKTEIHKNSYTERMASRGIKDPVTMMGKLVNDVNRWLDGDDSINIGVTRRILSQFAIDAGKDHFAWREVDEATKRDVSDAATWARRADRLKIEPTVETVTLYRAESPTVKYEDVFKSGGLTDFKPPKGVKGKFYTSSENAAGYYKDTYGKDATITKIEVPKSSLEKYATGHSEEYYIPDKVDKPVRSKIKPSGGVQLNSMIPVDQIPEIVKKWFGGTGVRMNELRRNKKLLQDTGYWWNQDARRFMWEYSNHETTLKPEVYKLVTGDSRQLSELVKDRELFNHIPSLIDTEVKIIKGDNASYDNNTNTITIGENEISRNSLRKVLVHEIDHHINDQLRGSSGGNVSQFIKQGLPEDKAYQEYQKLTGEMQSRLTEKRLDMTPEHRKAEAPWETLDKMLESEGLPKSAGMKLYSDPFFIQAMIDTAKRAFKDDKFGKEKVDLSKIPEGKVKEGIKRGMGYMKAFAKDIESSERNASTSMKELYDLTAEALWNTKTRARRLLRAAQHDSRLENAAKVAEQKMINEAGGHAYGQIMFEQFSKEVYGGLSKNEKNIVNALVRGKRVVDIATYKPEAKFPLNQGFEDALYYEANFEGLHGLTKERASELLRRRDAYFEHMKDLVDVRLEGGLIDEVMADGLKSHDYSKFKGIGERLTKSDGSAVDTFSVERLFDEKNNSRVGGKVQSVNTSGIDSLARGKRTDILETNQQITALEMYNRVYGSVFKNNTFQSLAEIARLREDNGFVKLGKKETKLAREAREAEGIEVDKLPNIDQRGWVKHNFWEGGKKKAIYLQGDFAEGMGSAGRDISPRLAASLSVASISYIPKLMATGISPLWSTFVNFPIDQLNVLLSNGIYEGGVRKRLYSTNPVVYGLQMGRDLGATFYDTFFRAHDTMNRTQYMRTAERGMQMPFMATQARLSRKGYKIPGAFSALQDVLGYHSTSMELWTRQAIAERVIRRRAKEQGMTVEEARIDDKIMDEAVATARDYLDFSQGGWFTKSVDQAGWMYLNASIQATKSFGRALKEDPKGTMMAVTQIIGMPTVGITIAAVLLNSKTHKEIPKYQEENNMNIPLSDSFRFRDSQGNERGMYVSLPIGSTAGFIKNVFKAGTMKAMYETGLSTEKPDYKSIFGSLKQTAPDIISLPPSLRALFQYSTNIDLRTMQDITPKTFTGADRKYEYTPGQTPQMAIDLGQRLNMSPDMLDMARKTLIGNNEYTAVLGYAYDKAFGDVEKDMKDEIFAVDMAKVPGFKRVFKLTKAGQERGDKQDEFIREAELERYIDRQNINYFSKALYWSDTKSARQGLMEYMRKPEIRNDQARYERLMEQADFIRDVRSLPDRSSWLRLWHEPASVKAKDYVDRLDSTKTPEEQAQLQKSFATVIGAKGYVGETFWDEFSKVKKAQYKRDLVEVHK